MNTLIGDGASGRPRSPVLMMGVVLALASSACAKAPMTRPSEPLSAAAVAWPDDIAKDAERVDRVCGARVTQLLADYQDGKQEQQDFKTLMGSITGGVGTVGGVIGGVGAYVIHSPSTMKTLTGVTGIVSAALGAVGAVVTLVVSPGAAKVKGATESLAAIEKKKKAARGALRKHPGTWSSADKEAWGKAAKDLESSCQ
jgi:hypothetical protein